MAVQDRVDLEASRVADSREASFWTAEPVAGPEAPQLCVVLGHMRDKCIQGQSFALVDLVVVGAWAKSLANGVGRFDQIMQSLVVPILCIEERVFISL